MIVTINYKKQILTGLFVLLLAGRLLLGYVKWIWVRHFLVRMGPEGGMLTFGLLLGFIMVMSVELLWENSLVILTF